MAAILAFFEVFFFITVILPIVFIISIVIHHVSISFLTLRFVDQIFSQDLN